MQHMHPLHAPREKQQEDLEKLRRGASFPLQWSVRRLRGQPPFPHRPKKRASSSSTKSPRPYRSSAASQRLCPSSARRSAISANCCTTARSYPTILSPPSASTIRLA